MTDRITFPGGELDEVVLTGASVHLERLDDTHYMLILEKGDGWRKNPAIYLHLVVENPMVFEYLIDDQEHEGEWRA